MWLKHTINRLNSKTKTTLLIEINEILFHSHYYYHINTKNNIKSAVVNYFKDLKHNLS